MLFRPIGITTEGNKIQRESQGSMEPSLLEKSFACVILEQLGVANIAAHCLDRAMTRNIHDLEQACAGFRGRRDEAGAKRVGAELLGIETDAHGVPLTISAMDRVLIGLGSTLP